jgi:enediyne biosynthesis protein E4
MRFSGFTSFILPLWLFVFISGCSIEPDRPFVNLPSSQTNINFSNYLENTPEFNIQNYLYFYDGGGVAAGDINNNGLPDLFFTGNMVEDRLYLNKGDFVFEEITESAGIKHDPDSWTTGVTMADITGNGYLDIYVSRVNYLTKSGANLLYINNGDNTFTERANEYGLDFEGYSTQAAFFDYNNNGRLDLFLLNHSFHSENTYGQAEQLRQRQDPRAGDRLFRNDGDRFTDVTREAGIISSALGYGLGLAISDINQNGLPDIYVGNDFHEDDYFYINNGDGTFTEHIYSMFRHTSNSSMGNDIADINNNGRPDVISLDMMGEDHETFMRAVGPDMPLVYETKKGFGFGDKNHRNTLQVNMGVGSKGLPVFSEIAFASGVARTDWSWAALLADFDNSGFADLFVSNGMPGRPNDLDYVNAIQRLRQQYSGDELNRRQYELIDRMPTIHVPNYMFRNRGDLTFEDVSDDWGFSAPTYSSGSVYADLNGNGKLDLVVSNINEKAFIFKNNFTEEEAGNYLKIKLNGSEFNTTGIGSKVILYHENGKNYREQFPTRGFQSSVDHVLHFGLGEVTDIDSMLVIWPDGLYQKLEALTSNQLLELNYADASGEFDYAQLHTKSFSAFRDITENIGWTYSHRENNFDDFNREPLMPYKLSRRGPGLATADITGNGLDDIYMGGARGQAGKLFLQQNDGSFVESEQPGFDTDRNSEDVDAIFFDATGNGHLDLYVVSGGHEYTRESPELADRLYLNDGKGNFIRSENNLPRSTVNGSVVKVADYNGNGHLDLFVGGHSIPWNYGVGPQSLIFENNGEGIFTDVTQDIAPELETIGNVTSASWIQKLGSPYPDLVVAGEWMSVKYFENVNGVLTNRTDDYGLSHLTGLWQSLAVADLTGNGHDDIVLGNFGINSRIQADQDNPIRLYINDFDDTGQTDPIMTYMVDGREKPFEQLDELRAQIPTITDKVRNYQDYSTKVISDLFDRTKLNEALTKEIRELRSLVLLNNGDGSFETVYLPFEAQWFPVTSILPKSLGIDGRMDLVIAGNIFDVKPSMGGKQDAGYGLILKGNGLGSFSTLTLDESGFIVKGESRSILEVQSPDERKRLIIARNNDTPLFFELNETP